MLYEVLIMLGALLIMLPALLSLGALLGRLKGLGFGAQPQPSPVQPTDPYRDAALQDAIIAQTDPASSLRMIATNALDDRDKYRHALEAISTINQDTTSQRIAKQALGMKP